MVAIVAVEGACDYFFGRPLAENPYSEDSSDHFKSWRAGWREAEAQDDMRGDEEHRRWR